MKNLKLASRDKVRQTVIAVGEVAFGRDFVVIAGPCSVESERQTIETAQAVKAAGADMMRGGAFKPRTSPYSFQGLGLQGLKILAKAREETGLPIVTEVLDPRDVSWVAEFADVLQIGARNMQNFPLLMAAGRIERPVMLKRGISATIEEWLNAAEYIYKEGNHRVILCERGVRGFDSATRNLYDVAAVPLVQRLSHLPIIVDPSHAAGDAAFVTALSRAAVAVGADGLLVEVHPDPRKALSDGEQSMMQ